MLTAKTQGSRVKALSARLPAGRQAVSLQLTPQLTSPVRYLKGVGPEKQKIMARLGLEKLSDLFYFFPRRYEKRFPVKKIAQLSFADKECVAGVVTRCGLMRLKGGRSIFKVIVTEDPVGATHESPLHVLFYNQPYLANLFQPGKKALFYGKAEKMEVRRRWCIRNMNFTKEICRIKRCMPDDGRRYTR